MNRVKNLERHDHVLGIVEMTEDAEAYYVVMERAGSELFDFLATEEDVKESECQRIIREILLAAEHFHKNGLVHRDIKPDNIVFQGKEEMECSSPTCTPKTLKLIDFDLCQEY